MSFASVSVTGKVNFVNELTSGNKVNKGVSFGIGVSKTVSMAKCPSAKPMSNNPEMGTAYMTIVCNAWGYNGNNKFVDYLLKNLQKGVYVSIKNADLDLDPTTGGPNIYTGSDGQPRSRIRITLNSSKDIEIINPNGLYPSNENSDNPQQSKPMQTQAAPQNAAPVDYPAPSEYEYGPSDDLEIPF